MIAADQPSCFPSDVLVAVSSRSNGTMLDRVMGVYDGSVISNRTIFCSSLGVDYGDTVFQRIVYGNKRDYRLICEADDGSTTKFTSEVVADALITRSRGVALMLPVADCVATVIYSPDINALSLLHLGRHSTLTPLLSRVINRLAMDGADVSRMIVWMSPSAQASHYVMEYFEQADDPSWDGYCTKKDDGFHLDLQGYNKQVCLENGLRADNIFVSSVNTVTSPNYFSHSAGDTKGRFAVLAMLR